MFTPIIVPLDGSARAERAISYASTLAWALNGRIILFRALSVGESKPEAEASLSQTSEKLASDGVPAQMEVVFGEAAVKIAEIAEVERDSLIVMSTHGRSGLGRWLYGSVAEEVLRHVGVPVVLVSSGCERPWPLDRPLRVLAPVDGSELSEQALVSIGHFAETLHAELTLLHVLGPPVYASSDTLAERPTNLESAEDQAITYLKELGRRVQPGQLDPDVRVIVGHPHSAIASTARREDLDLIAMATHGSGGYSRARLGSVATVTIQQASVPTLLLSPISLVRPTE
ncbi:MAG TPA: universal stress protein [Chloroflexota bacterium]|nr:universal stress protein [Chloroflexota bacterium]